MIDLDYTIFVQLGIFLVLFLILRSLLFKPYLALFQERERLVAGIKEEVAALEREFNEKSAEFDAAVREATARAAASMEKVKADAQIAQREILGKARQDASRKVEDAVKALHEQVSVVRGDLEREIGLIAVQIAEKVLGRKIG